MSLTNICHKCLRPKPPNYNLLTSSSGPGGKRTVHESKKRITAGVVYNNDRSKSKIQPLINKLCNDLQIDLSGTITGDFVFFVMQLSNQRYFNKIKPEKYETAFEQNKPVIVLVMYPGNHKEAVDYFIPKTDPISKYEPAGKFILLYNPDEISFNNLETYKESLTDIRKIINPLMVPVRNVRKIINPPMVSVRNESKVPISHKAFIFYNTDSMTKFTLLDEILRDLSLRKVEQPQEADIIFFAVQCSNQRISLKIKRERFEKCNKYGKPVVIIVLNVGNRSEVMETLRNPPFNHQAITTILYDADRYDTLDKNKTFNKQALEYLKTKIALFIPER